MNGDEIDPQEKKHKTTRPAHLHRVSANDAGIGKEFFKRAIFLIEAEDQTQRQVFKMLMPELYILKNIGHSYKQIAALLEACGLKLLPSTVRKYFSQMLPGMEDECVSHMAQYRFQLKEIMKEIEGVDMSQIAEKVKAIIDSRPV